MSLDLILKFAAIIVPIFLFILASTWGVVGWLVNSLKNTITEQLKAMSKSLKLESDKIAKVERSLLELKADLPREYLRREDHIRYSAIIEAKLDGHAEALNRLNLNVQRALDRKPDDEEGDSEK